MTTGGLRLFFRICERMSVVCVRICECGSLNEVGGIRGGRWKSSGCGERIVCLPEKRMNLGKLWVTKGKSQVKRMQSRNGAYGGQAQNIAC